MEKVILNKLPAPTFRWLGVNHAERAIEETEYREEAVCGGDGVVRLDAESGAEYVLNAEDGGELSVIMYVKTDSKVDLRTRVAAGEGAHVKVVQVFENKEQVITRIGADLADNAEFELVQLYIGGEDTVSDIDAELRGRRTKFTCDVGYITEGSDKLDLNLLARHAGKKSESSINVKGVMKGCSEKIFKGTIDFLRGAAGAKGAEQEDVLLVDESVRNRTVPLILCAEEDVEGSHGASIGRIDEGQIFYMLSRGIPEDKIYELMAQARIGQILRRIGDEETVERINKVLGRGEEE